MKANTDFKMVSMKGFYIQLQKIDINKTIRSIIMFIITFTMLYPFLWMLSASFTQERQVFNFPFRFIPDPINLNGYINVWKRTAMGNPMTLYFWNSIKVTAIGMIGGVLSSSLAAYGYSKIKFPGRDKIFLLKLSTMMIPTEVVMLPNFLIYYSLGLVDSHAALYIPTFFGATFAVFLLRQYFISIPYELNESAEIDGAGNLRIFWQIIMPLAKPALAAIIIFSFTFLWNSYELPLIYLRTSKLYTLPLALKMISEDKDIIQYSAVMAGSVITAIPVIIVFIAAQKYFIGGITMSGIKG